MLLATIDKTPLETFPVALNFERIFKGGETFQTCDVVITDELTGDIMDDLLGFDPVSFIQGVATAGNTVKLQDTMRNFAARGVRPGHQFYNTDKGWRATVLDVVTTTAPFDTLLFDRPQVSPVQAGDAYRFYLAFATVLPGGISGKTYLMTWSVSTPNYSYTDVIRINIL